MTAVTRAFARARPHVASSFVESAERTFAQIDAFRFDLERLAFVKAAVRAATTG